MTDPLDAALGTALHDRVADTHPDLDHLVTASVRAGIRIRRRRRVGVSIAAAAGVAAVAVGAALIAPGGDPRPVDGGVGFASEPTASADLTPSAAPLVAGSDLTTPHGTRVQVQLASKFQLAGEILSSPPAGTTATFALVFPDGIVGGDLAWVTTTYPDQIVATAAAPGGGLTDHAPVEVTAKGWTCQWFLADDKASCKSPAGAVVGLVIRPAAEHASWLADADKGGAGAGVYTTAVHGDLFLSVQGSPGSSQADVDALGSSLRWVH